jgi:erythromycin esterase
MVAQQEDSTVDSGSFVAWAQGEAIPLSIPQTDENYDDLGFLGEVIGDARIVAMAENAHFWHEWNRFRARLFKYLVEAHGFNTFVLESGIVESRNIHEYVAGADVDWDTVVKSVTNAWGVWAELQELIQWMRGYNANPDRDRELRFYGMDGTGNWFHAQHAFNAVVEFGRKVDADLANDVKRSFEGPVRDINLDRRGEVDEATWRNLIAESTLVVNRIEQHRLAYIQASSQDDYDWALRSAEILRDMLLMMAQTGDLNSSEGFLSFWNVRDVSMASSLEWILKREGPDARIVVGAANAHLQRYPVRVTRATSMGSYIENRIGREKMLIIGAASTYSTKGEEPPPDTNPAAYDQVGPECYFLDLRKAPTSGPVAKWLNTERMSRHNLRYGPEAPGQAYDCLLFHRTVSIAEVALAPSMVRELATPDPSRFDDHVGRYVVIGFLAKPHILDISLQVDKLYASGQEDTSGELFPPYQTEIRKAEDGRFVWADWPAVVEFHASEGPTERVTITMPGLGVYQGKRVEVPD